jgi:L-rhamnonate dehydratase
VAAPLLIGQDPLRTEQLWDKMYWKMSPRGQGGYASHAIAAIDVALWDIKGKALKQPVWKLLGGARDRTPLYVTFGFHFLDRDQLVAAAKYWVKEGFKGLKMVVGHQALQRRDEPRSLEDAIHEDSIRVHAVREAIGPDIALYIDANCSLDYFHAHKLAEMIRDCNLAFFEEPVTQNDVLRMAELRRTTGTRVAAGQNEGLGFRFRDMAMAGAVDVMQPNVVITGGYSQCVRIAGLASAFNIAIDNGGGWSYHNMHLHAGVMNGGLVEHHVPAAMVYEQLFTGLPEAKDSAYRMPEIPGLGFDLNRAAFKEAAKAFKPGTGG